MLEKILGSGGIAVIPTDTIYGLVGSALNRKTVEKIYTLRKRDYKKPMIILISSIEDLKRFGIHLTSNLQTLLSKFWPNPVSIILPCPSADFQYLHRGTNSLAFRLPKNKPLLKLLKQTGPLVAPSANTEGKPPVETIDQAKKFFGGKVDFYVDGGRIKAQPSTLIKIAHDKVKILRKGTFKTKISQELSSRAQFLLDFFPLKC